MSLHKFPVTVFYEDTDMAGIVYYANYLKFIERARSTMVLEAGIDQNAMKAEDVVFVVTRVEADYIGSAKLNDTLTIETQVTPVKKTRLQFSQTVLRDGQKIFHGEVTVVCARNGRPIRIPDEITTKMKRFTA